LELTTKQEKQLGQTQWFHATLLRHLESLKSGIDVKFNLGSELDFGPGFYITPDFEQARKFIIVWVQYFPKEKLRKPIRAY